MNKHSTFGYTLVEILVVMTVMSIIAVIGFTNLGNLKKNQDLQNSVANLQNYFRIAQINATSGVKCNGEGGASWQITFENSDAQDITLKCQAETQNDAKTIPLGNSDVKIQLVEGSNCTLLTYPISVSFSSIYGKVEFLGTDACLSSTNKLTITLENISQDVGNEDRFKKIIIDKG